MVCSAVTVLLTLAATVNVGPEMKDVTSCVTVEPRPTVRIFVTVM